MKRISLFKPKSFISWAHIAFAGEKISPPPPSLPRQRGKSWH